tara:strand:- start:2 stop:499 length:498 start_codon:yes stop_codon:yes gene_type:complete
MNAILACDYKGGIGIDNKLPWTKKDAPGDLKFFKEVTENKILIMGSKTWDSLPFKPLKNRINVILTSKPLKYVKYKKESNVIIFTNKDSLIDFIDSKNPEDIFVIGGSQIIDLLISKINIIYLTILKNVFKCDTYISLSYYINNFNYEVIENSDFLTKLIFTKKN